MKRFYLFTAVMLVTAVIVAVLSSTSVKIAASDGGVVFSHIIHNDLVECNACHPAEESDFAADNLLPAPVVCADCHDDGDVRAYWSLDEQADLSVSVLTPKDRKLYFSHKQHIGMDMSCGECHGAILADEYSGMPEMKLCTHCHNNADASVPIVRGVVDFARVIPATNQCEACHTTLAGLYPQSHLSASFYTNHGRYAMNGEASRDCAVCHSQSFCQECHTPSHGVPTTIASDRFYIETSPRTEKMDDSRVLTVQKAHPLTYRYTHGFDARAKSSRCATCHEQESFCAPCHQNGYDATGMRIVPQSHQLAGFVMLGGSAAMNRHGKLARMDMESCATCHQIDGGDPICAACHSSGIVTGGMR